MKFTCPFCGGIADLRIIHLEADITCFCTRDRYVMVSAGGATPLAAKRMAIQLWRKIGGKAK